MSTTPSTSAQQSSESSGGGTTPDSETSRTKRAYKKSCSSPSLRAFNTYGETLAKFANLVRTIIDQVGVDDVNLLRTDLERLDTKCESMREDFERFICRLDKAIENYEKNKPTDLVADENSVILPEAQAAKRSSLFKDKNTTDEIFTALNQCITDIEAEVCKKINKSIYGDQYSISLEKKLKKLKNMCEANIGYLKDIRKMIKGAIEKNEGIRRMNNI